MPSKNETGCSCVFTNTRKIYINLHHMQSFINSLSYMNYLKLKNKGKYISIL